MGRPHWGSSSWGLYLKSLNQARIFPPTHTLLARPSSPSVLNSISPPLLSHSPSPLAAIAVVQCSAAGGSRSGSSDVIGRFSHPEPILGLAENFMGIRQGEGTCFCSCLIPVSCASQLKWDRNNFGVPSASGSAGDSVDSGRLGKGEWKGRGNAIGHRGEGNRGKGDSYLTS